MKTSTAQMKVLALVAVAMAQERSGDRTAFWNSFQQTMALVSGDPSLRGDGTLGKIALARAALGQWYEAVETAGMIPSDVPRNIVLVRIAGSQARLGNVKEVLRTAQAIRGEDSEFWKAVALARIGKVQGSRRDQAAATTTFQNAIRSVESIKDYSHSTVHVRGSTSTAVRSMAYFRGLRLSGIAKAQAQSSEKTAGAATFEKALAEARGMPDPPKDSVSYEAYSKDMLFYLIAKDQAEAGLVKSALQTAGEIRVLPVKLLVAIGECTTSAGHAAPGYQLRQISRFFSHRGICIQVCQQVVLGLRSGFRALCPERVDTRIGGKLFGCRAAWRLLQSGIHQLRFKEARDQHPLLYRFGNGVGRDRRN